ncbi:histidine kinase [Rhodanobacter thiooxydans]|uniref:Histidine kinase n=1 Tax=Rhodanobacter thiooxydans TaxID=416169 RepID=A0A154QFB8_9GAMM|nr:response regulator [Rhodanobacter thiooxydans]EIM03094.1 response regulator receiver protein [Rhodanobacter thiooxydans LCS2]KZC22866.1 histidine kinase [Rhodanobacter thiooxydans]MCW0200707.1 response regulator [Rhodanobacter thiooxydans]
MDGHALMNGLGFFKRLLGNQTADGHRVEPQAALGARMLVVDDSPTICAVLGKMLHQDGYAVLKATGGAEAIELARRERPALIFLDVVMPGTNGFAVLRTLRHDPLTRDIPIVMISGNPQATEQFYLQRFGADDFMQKPFGRDEVYLRIGQLVRSGRLDGRLPTAPAAAEALPALAEELSADELADIPDIAMPDAEAAPRRVGTALLRVVPGIG